MSKSKTSLVIGLWKFSRWAYRHRLWFVARVMHRLTIILTGADIPPMVNMDDGVSFPHPVGVVISGNASIGVDCTIMSGVVLGEYSSEGSGQVELGRTAPSLERRVFVGAGAKILGPVLIGDGARIGANAVVLQDVPSGATAVGVPARVIMPLPMVYKDS